MKIYNKTLLLLLSLLLFQGLTACTSQKEKTGADVDQTASPSTEVFDQEMDGSQNLNGGAFEEAFTTNEQPVAAFDNSFIIRNKSGNLYGLIDRSGEEILPCEFEEMEYVKTKSQTVVKAQSKGSYGVYDLSGDELIPCQYTELSLSPYEDLCIATTFTGEHSVLSFSGETIIPAGYDVLGFGYGKILMAGRSFDETRPGEIAAYDSNGNLIKSFPLEMEQVVDLSAMNGGDLIRVTYMDKGMAYTNFDSCLVVSGDSNVWSNTQVAGEYLFYFRNGSLIARNIETGDESIAWEFPGQHDWIGFEIGNPDKGTDAVTGVSFVDFSILGHINGQKDEGRTLRVVLDSSISTIDLSALGVNLSLGSRDEVGSFYNGVAMVFPADGYLYTIDTSGQVVNELKNPYTDRDTSYLIDNAAILNNNGFYSIIDANGNPVLSDDGYSDIQKMMGGCSVVTDQDGNVGLINALGKELLSCGEVESIESGAKYVSTQEWELESAYSADSELLAINKGQSWALYSLLTDDFVTDFFDVGTSNGLQYNYAYGDGGCFLIDESGRFIYAIINQNGTYKVQLIN